MDRAGSGFRRLIVLLLLVNLAVLAAGWAGTVWLRQPAPLVTFNTDKIRLLEDALPRHAGEVEDETAAPLIQEAEATGQENRIAVAQCMTWVTLDADHLAQLEAHLRGLGVAQNAYDLSLNSGMRLGWWVYLPPFADETALRAVMEDARAKGVVDISPVREGSMRRALSLGAFPTLDAARTHAERLGRKGLTGVRYAPRIGAGAVTMAWSAGADPAQKQRLSAPWPPGLAPNGCVPQPE